MLLSDGIPIIYEGQEQHYSGSNDPYNREAVWPSGYSTTSPLYNFIAEVNQIRNLAMSQDPSFVDYMAVPVYNDATTIAMRKGFDGHQIVGVFSNQGSGGASYSLSVPGTGFTSGAAVTEVLGCSSATVGGNGSIDVPMGAGAPKIFYATSNLKGSGVCGN
jgi:alpha-amylase